MPDNQKFYAGAARVDITPPMGTILGVDYLPHYARFIHDPLHAKALVCRKGSVTIAIVIVDICIMGTDFMDDIKMHIGKQTGIDPQNILLASNHNHASGNVVGLLGGAVDIEYRKKLPPLVVQAVQMAKENLRPAKIATGTSDVPEYVLCRRYLMKEGYEAKNPVTGKTDQVKTNPFGAEHLIEGPAGPTDPGLGFLAVKGMDERWIAVLGNYSLHYAADWPDDSVTADYFGEFSRQIQEKLNAGKDFVGIMSNGTSGDVNIWDFMHPDRFPGDHYAKTKLIGGVLAEKVFQELKNVQWQNDPSLAVQFAELELSIRKPSPAELEAASKLFIENDFDNLGLKNDAIQRIYTREQLLLNEYPDTVLSPVQAIKIGNLIIGALGGEFFAETGLLLKRSITGYNYFSISLANAYGGYIPPAHEMERGGYETWRARSSFMEANAEEKIRAALLELILEFQ
jgi:neutral ceramidase